MLALIIALIVQFSGGMPENAVATPDVKPTVLEDKSVIEDRALSVKEAAPVTTAPVAQITPPAAVPQLPLNHATFAPVSAIAEPTAVTAPPTVESKSALILPSDAVKVGSTAFLNGNWRVSPEIKAAQTGKAPSLKYQIKNGKGTVKITHGDNVTCRANITAGVMKSGNLVINSRYRAQCSDGSKYQMPEIVCKQGVSGVADCKGRYDANTTLPMTMKRETK